MVTGIRPSLLAGRIDVTKEVVSGRLVPSSSSTRLTDGHFTIDRLIGRLEKALDQALYDSYHRLWGTGDMPLKFGPERDCSKLLDYEWRLEERLRSHQAPSGICQ